MTFQPFWPSARITKNPHPKLTNLGHFFMNQAKFGRDNENENNVYLACYKLDHCHKVTLIALDSLGVSRYTFSFT